MQTFCGLTTDGMLDYLSTIFKLSQEDQKVTTSTLAEAMHVSSAAASSMAKRLEESGFLDRSSGDGNRLTEQGRLAALQLIRRHRLLEVFLIEIMQFTWDQVDLEAHRLQHAVSATFEDRMDRLCNYPTHCPHGDPIPKSDGTMPSEELRALTEMAPGQAGLLRRVGNKDPRVLRYLAQLDLIPGHRIRLLEQAPFNGPVTLEVLGSQLGATPEPPMHILGKELAEQLFVVANGSVAAGAAD